MPTKLTKVTFFLRRFISYIIPFIVLQYIIYAFISHARNPFLPAVEYSSSLGHGASAKAYPAIIKVNNGKFSLLLFWQDEAAVLERVKGQYVVKLYGEYRDRGGLDVLILERIDGRPIFRPAAVYTASFTVKMRVLREMLYALRHIHEKGMQDLS
jgi:serine/threonine protein kinase